jgi:hypothetical protein
MPALERRSGFSSVRTSGLIVLMVIGGTPVIGHQTLQTSYTAKNMAIRPRPCRRRVARFPRPADRHCRIAHAESQSPAGEESPGAPFVLHQARGRAMRPMPDGTHRAAE